MNTSKYTNIGRIGISVLLAISLFSFRSISVLALTFVDNSQVLFSAGNFGTGTAWNATTSGVELNTTGKTAGNAVYTSNIKDTANNSQFNSIAYTPTYPTNKELPNNNVSETVYGLENMNMTGNFALFHFNETTGVTANNSSSSGSTINATCNTTICPTFTTTSKFGNAFNAQSTAPITNGGFKLPLTATLQNQTQVSFTTWIRASNVTGTKVIYEEPRPGSATIDRISLKLVNNRVQFTFRTDAGVSVTLIYPATTLLANTWYHIVAVYDSVTDSHQMYINGVQNTAAVAVGSIPNTPPTNPPTIGAQASNSQIFIGQIDELGIFTRVLTSAEATALFRRGATRLLHQVRSCDDSLCSGEIFVGPNGTAATYYQDVVTGNNTLPNLPLTNISNNQYIQYQSRFETDDTNATAANRLTASLRSLTLDYTLSPISLTFAIRRNDDLADENSCNMGTVTTTTTGSCSYRLKVSTTSNSGYFVYIQLSGNLNAGTETIANATVGTGGSGGNDISSATAGTERYGCLISPGVITSGSSLIRPPAFFGGNSGNNAVLCNYTTPTLILTANGTNNPLASGDTTNTSLMVHQLNISGQTPAGEYTQTATYTVVPRF
jgi:hypothetical protein